MREGKLRAAGVSNFGLAQLRELVQITEAKPAVLQANSGAPWGGASWGPRHLAGCRPPAPRCCRTTAPCCAPPVPARLPPPPTHLCLPADLLNPNWELQAFCRRHGILFQGYSTLGGQHLAQVCRGRCCPAW